MHNRHFLSCLLGVGLIASDSDSAELVGRKPNAPRIAPASDEAELALKRFRTPPGFKAELFAAEPLLAHPVAFAIDEKNRIYVAESFRVGEQVTDIRGHMRWLDEELASTNTAQWRLLIEKYLDADFMTRETERLTLLEDTNGDGKADQSTVFAEGFHDLQSGIAAGVLARKGEVWFTCIPDLWRLRDTNHDGRADTREALQHGYGVRFGFYGHDLHGLRIGPDGKLYFSIGDRGFNVLTKEGKRVAAPEMGAVLRCNLDGSGLEIFAMGLRNPQELAFDDYGNLFTGDNNSDGGDQARWVYLVEGGDSGWRIGWQFITRPVPRGPWNAEKMWHPQNDDQPAYLVPPLANLANGPSGLTFYPGTGLPPEFDRHFFLADFKGNSANSLIHCFGLSPQGASFSVVNQRPFVSQILATDVDFGMDGALYLSDWVTGWGKTGKGRIYRVYHPQARGAAVVASTSQLMAAGFENRPARELAALLAWPDQRVRQEAQFELAARGNRSLEVLSAAARQTTNQLARLHAVWGLAQIREAAEPNAAGQSLAPLVALLQDADAEVRAQTAKVLGDARHAPASSVLAQLATGLEAPRVQFFAALALGKIGGPNAAKPILEMLRQNADADSYLRHAGVMALHYLNDPEAIEVAARDRSPAVRMAALLSWRRQFSPQTARFLDDPEPRLVLEAARAIYDLPIPEAIPELARLIKRPIQSEPLARRVINANFRLGTASAAMALAEVAADSTAPAAGRVEALLTLEEWGMPSGRDRVTGLWRPLAERDPGIAAGALRPVLSRLLEVASDEIPAIAARIAAKFQIRGSAEALARLAQSEGAGPKARIESLRALATWNDPALVRVLERAGASRDEAVRKEATALLARLDPGAGAELLDRKLASGSLGEQQAALAALGSLQDPRADQILGRWLDQLLAGKVGPALQLELLESAATRPAPALREQLARFEASRPKNTIGNYVECLSGGNAIEGRKVFFERAEASCARCHKVGGEGADVGPPLDRPDANRAREHLLESIVAPNAVISPGFENAIIRLKDGGAFVGVLKSESASELTIVSPEDGPVTVPKNEISSRDRGGSGMPEGLGNLLTKRDLRDLVEFLATLK